MKISEILTEAKQGVEEGIQQQYLWHGSRQPIKMLEPRQSVDTGGASGSNQNAIYATSDPKVAIAMGLTTPGSDTGMFPNDPQMVLFSGKVRKGQNVYLHKVPFYGPDGKPQFVQGGNSREFHSIPGVTGIKPIEIKAVPVNKYLNLIRQATPADLELQKKYMKKQGVAEDGTKPDYMKSGNMQPKKVSGREKPGAVDKLKTQLLAAKGAGKKLDYDSIDAMMQRICGQHNLTGDKLHDDFVDETGMIPDNWIKKQKSVEETAKYLGPTTPVKVNKQGKQIALMTHSFGSS
jgi:hypothetical protein